MNDTDLTDSQVLRWLKAKADELAKEFRESYVSVHASGRAGTGPDDCRFDIFLGNGSRIHYGSSVEEAADKWRAERSSDGLMKRAAELRAEADRLEREAAQ